MLTYSQVGGLDPTLIVRHIQGLGATLVLGREPHEDGGTHFHAFIHFDKRPNFKRSDVFDVEGFHPNVSVTKGRPSAGYDYATKTGDIVHADFERPTSTKEERNAKYLAILASENESDFFKNAEEHDPGLVLKSYISLRACAKDRYTADPILYEVPEGYAFRTDHVEGLDDWVREFLREHQIGGELSYTYAWSPPGRVSLPPGGPTLAPYGEPMLWCAGYKQYSGPPAVIIILSFLG